MVDGVEGKEYDGLGGGMLTFSPDSKRVAYWARRGDRWLVVLDGVEGPEYAGCIRGSRLVFEAPDVVRAMAAKGLDCLLLEIRLVENPP